MATYSWVRYTFEDRSVSTVKRLGVGLGKDTELIDDCLWIKQEHDTSK